MLIEKRRNGIGGHFGTTVEIGEPGIDQDHRCKADNENDKGEGIKVFLPLPIYIFLRHKSRSVSQLPDQRKNSFIGMGKGMDEVVPDMIEIEPVGISLLPA